MPARSIRPFPPLLAGLLTAAVVLTALYVAKPVIIPLAVSVLLAFVLTPVVALVQRYGLPRVPAVLLTTLVALGLLGAAGYVMGTQVRGLVREVEEHKGDIQKKLQSLIGTGGGILSDLSELVEEAPTGTVTPGPGLPAQPPPVRPADGPPKEREQPVTVKLERESGAERLLNTALPVVEPLATVALVVVLVVFLLVNREDLRNRVIGLLGHGHLTGTTRVLGDAGERVGSYLLSQLLVNLGFGLVFGVGLWLIGVQFAFLWGALAVALRFIPYVGSWIACAFPLALSFATSPGLAQPATVLAFFAVLDLVVGQVIEPVVFGHQTGVSPVALLVAAAFWGWLWGPIGLLLSTPLTVCLVTLGQHVPRLGFLSVLMSDRPGLAPHLAFYQRLLAKDEAEAKEVMLAHTKAHGLADTFDAVLVPALVAAGRDRKREELSADDEAAIVAATEGVRAAVAAPPPVGEGEEPPPEPVTVATVFGFPARGAADELTVRMLADLLRADGYPVEVIPTRVLPKAVDARIQAEKPAVLVVNLLPPGGLPQGLYQVKRLRAAHPDVPIVAAYLGQSRRFDDLLVRFRQAGASYVVSSLAQAAQQVKAIAPGNPAADDGPKAGRRQPAGVA
jgi:predicted PurR-regulated permease PerM